MKKYFLFLILFIFPLYVKAYYNDGFGLTLSEDGVFYSLNTYPSKTNIGYHVSSVLYPTGDGWGAKPPESASASYGTNGGMFVQCGMSFVPDNYYSVTYVYLFNGYSSYLHPFYTAWKNHLAIGTNNAVEHSQDYVTIAK